MLPAMQIWSRQTGSVVLGCVGCVALAFTVGCDDKPMPSSTSPTASASVAKTTTSSAQPALPTPKPLDVKALKKSLKCGDKGHGPCAVLDQFETCEKWSAITQSGDGRWMGVGSAVTKGKFIDEITLMRSRRVPTKEVGAGQLGAKISITNIPDTMPAEIKNAEKAVKAYARGDVPKRGNSALRYVEERPEWPEAFTMQADANQIYVAVAGGGFICSSKGGQKLNVVRLAGSREHPADGVYATMYPVKW